MAKLLTGYIAKQVSSAMKKAGMTQAVTLIKVMPGTRGTTISGGTQPTTVSYAAQGFIDDYNFDEYDGTLIARGDRRVYMFGASIAGGQTPAPNDETIVAGIKYRIVAVGSDPANAMYICQSRGAATP